MKNCPGTSSLEIPILLKAWKGRNYLVKMDERPSELKGEEDKATQRELKGGQGEFNVGDTCSIRE